MSFSRHPDRDDLLDRLEARLRSRTGQSPPQQPAGDQLNRDHQRRVEPDPDFVADEQWAKAQDASRHRITRRTGKLPVPRRKPLPEREDGR